MCGRYMLASDGEAIAEESGLDAAPDVAPRYNIAPSQPVLAVRGAEQGREGVLLRWGLVPFWAKDPKIGYRMINARSETVAEKPAFRAAFRKRRCVVPADGYYEWRKTGDGKQPYFIFAGNGRCFGIAGLWEYWEQDGNVIESCTLLTCAANARLAEIHDRMPVVLPGEAHARWLDPGTSADALAELLQPAPEDAFEVQPVSTFVNKPANDSPACIEPVAL